MRTNGYGFPIETYGNRKDTDHLIVHVMRQDNPHGRDINAVINPNGTLYPVTSLDHARAVVVKQYIKAKRPTPKYLDRVRKAAEREVRAGTAKWIK